MFTLLVAAVVISFTALQTAAAVEDHAHHHGGANHHCCAACHGGPLFALVTTAKLSLGTPQAVGWHTPPQAEIAQSLETRGFRTNRGPPVRSFFL